MGFKEVKHRVTKALKEGTYQHEARGSIKDKNTLMSGDISPEQLIAVIDRCNGRHHESSEHHALKGIEVHILKRDGWYIKFYFVDPNTVFISVHPSG